MAYQSKYTGLQIDDILDSVEWKQGKIEDLASIRAGAAKGATALQSYTEKYTGTVTGIKINGIVKSGSGVIDLGTISTDISGKQDKLVDGVNIATINGQSLTAGGDLTIEGGADIIVANKSDLDELYKDVPEGTKAVVVNNANDILGVNLFDFLTGTAEGNEEVLLNPNAYTLKISAVDTSVELPISDTADVYVTLPFNNTIKIEMGSDLASVSRILVKSGYNEVVWQDGRWFDVDMYLVGNEMPVSKLLNLDDNAVAGLMIIAPALIVDFVSAKTITEYLKNGDNWEVWSRGQSALNTTLNTWADLIYQNIPTKTSQLENDSNFVSSDGLKTINGESIVGSGDITIQGGSDVEVPTKVSQLENDAEYITQEDVAAVATSGSYNDLSNKPTIPAAVTESTVSGWGFTKNAGTYSKPSGGIPKSDLASAVQTSLGKADTALQSYTEQYKGTITGVSANGTSVATSGVANIPAASTSAYGVTKLSSATNSTSTTLAATASAVKAAYDLANSYKGTVTSVKVDNVSKSQSSGVVDLGYINKQLSTSTSSSMTLSPNIYYRNTSTSLSTLTITLSSVSNSNIINEYFVEFTTRSAGTTVSLPSTIKWANGETPTFEASTTYQISIVNNLGVVQKFK